MTCCPSTSLSLFLQRLVGLASLLISLINLCCCSMNTYGAPYRTFRPPNIPFHPHSLCFIKCLLLPNKGMVWSNCFFHLRIWHRQTAKRKAVVDPMHITKK